MKIAVIKKKDDPIALRISIGKDPVSGNAYIVYRGDYDKVSLLLLTVAQKFNQLKKEPEISDDDGKKFA